MREPKMSSSLTSTLTKTPNSSSSPLPSPTPPSARLPKLHVDGQFITNVKGVHAIGDVIPCPMLAHKAKEDGITCMEFLARKEGHMDYDMVLGVVYTHPEVASVGKTYDQVKATGVSYRVGKFPFLANSQAKATNDAEGIVKILAERR